MKLNSITVTVLLITAFMFIMSGMLMASDLDTSGSPVEKTGQKTAYATGDDGDLKAGVAWPNPRFTDKGDGTVKDNLTGLIWLKNANAFDSRNWDTGVTVEARNWATALTDCNTLNSGEQGLTDGSVEGDWRLPNVKELQSLIDFGNIKPALPTGHPFKGVQSNYYWSSTTHAGGPSHAWLVHMRNGHVDRYKKSYYNYVWPVRSDND